MFYESGGDVGNNLDSQSLWKASANTDGSTVAQEVGEQEQDSNCLHQLIISILDKFQAHQLQIILED